VVVQEVDDCGGDVVFVGVQVLTDAAKELNLPSQEANLTPFNIVLERREKWGKARGRTMCLFVYTAAVD